MNSSHIGHSENQDGASRQQRGPLAGTSPSAPDPVLQQLRILLDDYLKRNSQLTLNGISQRCAVSEPTLRRLHKNQIKTLPTVSTITDLLTYLSKKTKVQEIIDWTDDPLKSFLQEKVGRSSYLPDLEVSEALNKALKDPVKYLIYKLAANDQGIRLEKAVELFGMYGETELKALETEGWLEEKDGRFKAKIQSFALSHDQFVDRFKLMASFIKPEKLADASRNLSPMFSSYSSSVSPSAYSEILKIQRAANKKIAQVLRDENSKGEIPAFYLCAVDTLDLKSADEIVADQKQ